MHHDLAIDDFFRKKYIDIDALHTEYKRAKSIAVQKSNEEKQKNKQKKNIFSDLFKNAVVPSDKIDDKFSKQEAIIKIYEYDHFNDVDDDIVVIDGPPLSPSDIFTKGKLCYDCNGILKL